MAHGGTTFPASGGTVSETLRSARSLQDTTVAKTYHWEALTVHRMWEAVHRTLAGYVVAAPGCTAPAGTTSSQKPVGAKEAEAGKRGDESTMKSTK